MINAGHEIHTLDLQLAKAGWSVRLENLSEPEGDSGLAQYRLLNPDKTLLALVKVVHSPVDALEGERKAAEVANDIQPADGVKPFVYLVDPQQIWFLDPGRFALRAVAAFHSPDDLARLDQQRRDASSPAGLSASDQIIDRKYQLDAVRQVTASLEGGQRRFLLAMAAGSGKTRVAIALTDLLMRAGWVRRVLFLADRRELARQALTAFAEYLPGQSLDRIEGGAINPGASIHFATYTSMMQVFQKLSIGYYDLVIADECQRSLHDRYQALFDHFDALTVGLTAIPAGDISPAAYRLFNCPDGTPTYVYSYLNGVEEGYLARYEVVEPRTRFQVEGVKPGQLPEGLVRQLAEQGFESGEINFEGTDFERRVINPGTCQVVVQEIVERCRKDASSGLPAKTILFAMSHAHAQALSDAFETAYPEWQRAGLARVIDSRAAGADVLLEDFERQDMPRIAISIGMLDTGIDLPAVQNLVFARPVFSRMKFLQMIGRGTRLWIDPQTGDKKNEVLIIDFWGNFAYHNLDPRGSPANIETPRQMIRLRLPDRIVSPMWSAYGAAGEGAFVPSYREQVEARIRELSDQHPVLRKIQQGEAFSHDDLHELAFLLSQAGTTNTEAGLRHAYQQSNAYFLDFMRQVYQVQLANLEEEISLAFEQFIAARPHYNANQQRFLRMVRSFAFNRVHLQRQDFLHMPFIRAGNIEQLFSSDELDEILSFANQFADS